MDPRGLDAVVAETIAEPGSSEAWRLNGLNVVKLAFRIQEFCFDSSGLRICVSSNPQNSKSQQPTLHLTP